MKTAFLKEPNKKVYYLVVTIAVLSAIVACVSLFYNPDVNAGQEVKTISGQTIQLYGRGIYHNDSLSMAVQAKGQDLVTLFLGVPLLFFSLLLTKKKSLCGRFLLTGTLAYFLYTYLIYCFAGSYNSFFIFYVMIMGMSLFSFVACVCSFELENLKEQFSDKLPVRYLSISNIVFAILIALNWFSYLREPTTSEKLEHYTTLPVQAMDLGIILPVIVFGSIMLLRKNNWGYLLLPIVTMKGLTLLLALDAMILFMCLNKVEVSLMEIIIFPLYTLLVAFNFYLIQKNLNYKS